VTTLLHPRALAERLGLAVATLARWRVYGGGPPFKKIGGRVVYPADELETWLSAQPLRRSTADGSACRPRVGRKAPTRR
jgi:predicted site-specific integrase-resolvase